MKRIESIEKTLKFIFVVMEEEKINRFEQTNLPKNRKYNVVCVTYHHGDNEISSTNFVFNKFSNLFSIVPLLRSLEIQIQ